MSLQINIGEIGHTEVAESVLLEIQQMQELQYTEFFRAVELIAHKYKLRSKEIHREFERRTGNE